MPEIPTRQSQVFGPGSSGLEAASPTIAGSQAIEQAASGMANNLLWASYYARQQEQAEQVASAGNIIGTFTDALLKKAQDYTEVLDADPHKVNPRDVNKDYQEFVSKLTLDTLSHEDLQKYPYMQKYLSTHIPTIARSVGGEFQKDMNARWREQNQFKGLEAVDNIARNGALAINKDPSLTDYYNDRINDQLLGMMGSKLLSGEQANTARVNARLAMSDYRATNIIETNPQAYKQALESNKVQEFWQSHGISYADFTKAQRDDYRTLATGLVTMADKENDRIKAEALRLKKERYEATDQRLMNKFIAHNVNKANPALTFEDIRKATDPKNDELDGGTARSLENLLTEHINRGPLAVKTNPVVERELFKRIYLPDGDKKKIIDTTPIYDAYTEHQLSYESMVHLRDEFLRSRSPEGSDFGKEKARFLAGMEPLITKPGPLGFYADPSTPEKFASFARELDLTIDQYQREGKNPRVLFDPDSKEYFGKVAKSSKYQSTTFGTLETPAPEQPPSLSPRKSLDEIFGRKP